MSGHLLSYHRALAPQGKPVRALAPQGKPVRALAPQGKPVRALTPQGKPVGALAPQGKPVRALGPQGKPVEHLPLRVNQSEHLPLRVNQSEHLPLKSVFVSIPFRLCQETVPVYTTILRKHKTHSMEMIKMCSSCINFVHCLVHYPATCSIAQGYIQSCFCLKEEGLFNIVTWNKQVISQQ